MNFIKRHHILSIVIIFLIIITALNIFTHTKGYSFADLGVTAPTEKDCSALKGKHSVTPVSLSVNVPRVAPLQEKIKTLIVKYEGNITNDSFSSYQSYPSTPVPVNNDSFNLTIEFKKSRQEFLSEVSELIKSSGGTNVNYNYSDSTYDASYSPYASCANSLQRVKISKIQLEVLTKAFRMERNPENISLLSQSIYDARSTLQNSIDTMNSYMTVSDIPSVTISVSPTSQGI
jgi:hypothetical protein